MDHAHVLALYARFAGDRLTFLYSGSFHDEHTARLIALQEDHLEQEGASRASRGKLAFVMVEAYQNIVRHRVKDEALLSGSGRSIFLLRSAAEAHEVTAINAVRREDEQKLRAGLEGLEGMDLQQLKQVFLRGLQNEERTDRGGAGLGLIEMARRTGNPLRYAFAPIDVRHRLFALQVLVGAPKAWRSAGPDLFDLQRIVIANGISLICRGRTPASVQEGLLRMIDRDLDDDRALAERAKHAYLLITGAMADMAVGDEGPMVVVAISHTRITITVGAPMAPAESQRVMVLVKAVNDLDAPGLQRRYRDILLGRVETVGGLELSLMDLARRSTGDVRCSALDRNGSPFIVLEVDV
ncbi:MAG: SiaB family protein kinase [Flavobacteriales bacterium]